MRIGTALALAALLWAAPGCKQKRNTPAQAAQQAKRIPLSVTMGDPRSAQQLLTGFFDIEDGAWRWTAQKFTMELGTPLGATGRGASLEFRFSVPPPAIQKNGSIKLTASVDGNVLPSETYAKAGDYIYKQDVPGSLLAGESVKVTLETDKPFLPGGGDQRELGVIALSAALVRK